MADLRRLPGPIADIWDWQLQAACRDRPADVFFHTENERGAAREARDAAAKSICAGCPVIRDCASHALRVREPYGVWGGMTEEERDELYERREEPVVELGAVRVKAAAKRLLVS